MKRFNVFIVLLFAVSSFSYAQVRDEHPRASIFVLDYQSGNLVPAGGDQAILFKDSFIDLVLGTGLGKDLVDRSEPGDKRMVISQLDPQQNGNAFKVVYTLFINDQQVPLFTFLYNADQNTLYHYRDDTRRYEAVPVFGEDEVNLNNCRAYSNFNAPAGTYATGGDAYSTPVDVSVTAVAPPPPLPVYEQPECPTEGYLWQPGYWAYRPDGDGYYWVPGVWVAPPNNGLLWTPPYWGYEGASYTFHSGYWATSVGFYGGINYGSGYQGSGFVGGEWRANHFNYNTAVVRVNTVSVHNTYINKTVINNVTINNYTSYNGGNGVKAKPTPAEVQVQNQPHVPPTKQQIANQVTARQDPSQFAKSNGGKPAKTATAKPPVVPTTPPGLVGIKGNKTPPTPVATPPKSAPTGNPGLTTKPSAPANNTQKPGNGGVKPAPPANNTTRPGGLSNPGRPATPGDTGKHGNRMKKNTPGKPGLKPDTGKRKVS